MKIQLELFARERMNLALLQNRIPLISQLQIINDCENQLENLKLEISSDPEGVLSAEIGISTILPGEKFVLENPLLSHSWEFFKKINEKILGRILLALKDINGNILSQIHQDIEIEPGNVWLGQQAPLELLVSHIMPNSEIVQLINRKAADFLQKMTGNSALNGYQTKDRERVYQTAQAIYQAIREENIILRSGVAMILAGAIGNLIDRLLLGEVVDFLDFMIGDLHWYVFNFADSFVTIGMGIILYDAIILEKKRQAISNE